MSAPIPASGRVLDPNDRLSEVLFGLIMVLTFTGSLSVADAGRDDVRGMLIGALGCNVAWGIIDGILYVMGNLAERGRNLKTLHAVRTTSDPAEKRTLIAESLPACAARAPTPVRRRLRHPRAASDRHCRPRLGTESMRRYRHDASP